MALFTPKVKVAFWPGGTENWEWTGPYPGKFCEVVKFCELGKLCEFAEFWELAKFCELAEELLSV